MCTLMCNHDRNMQILTCLFPFENSRSTLLPDPNESSFLGSEKEHSLTQIECFGSNVDSIFVSHLLLFVIVLLVLVSRCAFVSFMFVVLFWLNHKIRFGLICMVFSCSVLWVLGFVLSVLGLVD